LSTVQLQGFKLQQVGSVLNGKPGSSLRGNQQHAKLKWLRITANMHAGGYDVYEAEGALPEPEWPAHDIDTLVEVAFRGNIITSLDHPVIQTLLGKI